MRETRVGGKKKISLAEVRTASRCLADRERPGEETGKGIHTDEPINIAFSSGSLS